MAAVEGAFRDRIEQAKRRHHGAGRKHLDLEVAAGHVVDLLGVILGVFVENILGRPGALPAHADRALRAGDGRCCDRCCCGARGGYLQKAAAAGIAAFGRPGHVSLPGIDADPLEIACCFIGWGDKGLAPALARTFGMMRRFDAACVQNASPQPGIYSTRARFNLAVKRTTFGLARRPRPSSLDRIAGVVEAGRRGMAAGDKAIDQRFVFGGEAIVERLQIIVPLFLGAGALRSRR